MTYDLQLKIALNLIPNIGPRLVRRLISYAGNPEAVFSEKSSVLEKIPGIGTSKISGIKRDVLLKKAEIEAKYVIKHHVHTYFYLDDDYPARLKECEDAPTLLFVKGDIDFNAGKILSVVGTRKASEYGKITTEEIIAYLAKSFPGLIIVSGLAYGIDITAHKAALQNNLKTIAALGHGLEFMYPSVHASFAERIVQHGALATEFHSHRKPDPGNFISRNRIIAGLADATLVIESAAKGGALITADIANSYNRDVLAVPGKTTDTHSKGCNDLIKTNKAALVESGEDVMAALGWCPQQTRQKAVQYTLFSELNREEEVIYTYLAEKGHSALDIMSRELEFSVAKLSAILLSLEFKNLVKSLPGKMYAKI